MKGIKYTEYILRNTEELKKYMKTLYWSERYYRSFGNYAVIYNSNKRDIEIIEVQEYYASRLVGRYYQYDLEYSKDKTAEQMLLDYQKAVDWADDINYLHCIYPERYDMIMERWSLEHERTSYPKIGYIIVFIILYMNFVYAFPDIAHKWLPEFLLFFL